MILTEKDILTGVYDIGRCNDQTSKIFAWDILV